MKKNVIVTGATGFIGKYVLLELLRQEYSVVVIVRHKDGSEIIRQFLSDKSCQMKDVKFILSDLSDLNEELFEKEKFLAWIHLAWGGVNREQIDDREVHNTNYRNSIHCLKLSKELHCECFFDIGSRAELDLKNGMIYESDEGTGINQYGFFKAEFHTYAKKFCIENKLKYVHVRLFSVIGVGDHPWSLVMTACDRFVHNNPMNFGLCEQLWNFVDVRDVAYRIVKLCEIMEKSKRFMLTASGTVHIASNQTRLLKEYIFRIHEICNSSSVITFGDRNGFDSYPDTTTQNMLFGEKSEIEFDDTIKWIRGRYVN